MDPNPVFCFGWVRGRCMRQIFQRGMNLVIVWMEWAPAGGRDCLFRVKSMAHGSHE